MQKYALIRFEKIEIPPVRHFDTAAYLAEGKADDLASGRPSADGDRIAYGGHGNGIVDLGGVPSREIHIYANGPVRGVALVAVDRHPEGRIGRAIGLELVHAHRADLGQLVEDDLVAACHEAGAIVVGVLDLDVGPFGGEEDGALVAGGGVAGPDAAAGGGRGYRKAVVVGAGGDAVELAVMPRASTLRVRPSCR